MLALGLSTRVLLTMPCSANWTISFSSPIQGWSLSGWVFAGSSIGTSFKVVVGVDPDRRCLPSVGGGQARGFSHPVHDLLSHHAGSHPALSEHVHDIGGVSLKFAAPLTERSEMLVDEFQQALLDISVPHSSGLVASLPLLRLGSGTRAG